MFNYFQHGRRHGKFGTDPIPFPDLSWCYLQQGTPVTIASDAAFHQINVHDGVAGTFFTNDPETFQNDFRTFSGVDYYGAKISTGGMYAVFGDGIWAGLSAAAVGQAYWTRQDLGGDASALSVFQWGRVGVLGTDVWDATRNAPHSSFFELLNVPGGRITATDNSGPLDATPVKVTLEAKQTGTGSPTVIMGMLIVKLGIQYLSNAGTFG